MYILGEGLVLWKWAGCHLAKLAEFMVLNLHFSAFGLYLAQSLW